MILQIGDITRCVLRCARARHSDLTRELPGWRRFPSAAQWLLRNPSGRYSAVEGLKADFARFIEERQQASGGPTLSQKEKDQLFDEFKGWASGASRALAETGTTVERWVSRATAKPT
jgi:hypothetical protein